MKLPNGHQAYLGDKLERYCLNRQHPKGKDKAALFQKRLGITIESKAILEAALLDAALHSAATLKHQDLYGDYYNTRFFMQTDTGKA